MWLLRGLPVDEIISIHFSGPLSVTLSAFTHVKTADSIIVGSVMALPPVTCQTTKTSLRAGGRVCLFFCLISSLQWLKSNQRSNKWGWKRALLLSGFNRHCWCVLCPLSHILWKSCCLSNWMFPKMLTPRAYGGCRSSSNL